MRIPPVERIPVLNNRTPKQKPQESGLKPKPNESFQAELEKAQNKAKRA